MRIAHCIVSAALLLLVCNASAENYYWEFQGSGISHSKSPYESCMKYFSYRESLFPDSEDVVLSNFRIVDVGKNWAGTGPGKIFHCLYDLEKSGKFFPDLDAQTNRVGEQCEYGKLFDAEVGECLDPVTSCPVEGNPVEVLTGLKIQSYRDFDSKYYPVKRYYRGGVSAGWAFNFEEKARLIDINGEAYLVRESKGKVEYLKKVSDGCWKGRGQSCQQAHVTSDGLIIRGEGGIKRFDQNGRLKEVRANGVGRVVARFDYLEGGDGLTIHTPAASLSVKYIDQRVSEIAVDDEVISYGYSPFGLIDEVVKGSHLLEYYRYQDFDGPGAQLVEAGYDGEPFAFWHYDSRGRVTKSFHAGGFDTFVFDYFADDVLVTNPLGKQTRYVFETVDNVRLVKEVQGEPSPNCAATNKTYDYYDNGTLKSKTDWEGNVTTYLRDDWGREISRTEAAGTPDARTITTEYHSEFNKPIKITEPGLITEMTYDSAGRLLDTKKTSTTAQ